MQNQYKKPIAIVGAGGQGREVLQLLRQINQVTPTWECIGWFDDGIDKGTLINGLPVLGDTDTLNAWTEPLAVVIAIGFPAIKAKVVRQIGSHPQLSFPVIVHPSVLWEPETVHIGRGTIVTQGCRMTVAVNVGEFVLLNIGTILTHDVVIGNYCSLMPSVNISGAVVVEEGCYIGTGTQIIQGLRIGTQSTIGAGSVVIRDIPPYSTAVGVPAKVVKSHR